MIVHIVHVVHILCLDAVQLSNFPAVKSLAKRLAI